MKMPGLVCLLAFVGVGSRGAGDWRGPMRRMICQMDRVAESAETSVPLLGEGGWRCVVEPGPHGGGIALMADGLELELLDANGGTLRFSESGGKVLWRDMGVGWNAYEPLWLETVQETKRIRVQLLAADGRTVVAMSPWLPRTGGESTPRLRLGTMQNTARFALWARVPRPFVEYTPNNPSALRIPQAGDTHWRAVGGGAWRWRTTDRRELQQTRAVERTTLIRTAKLTAEGTYRCRVRLNKGTCGGGMLVHTDAAAKTGYIVWCGGKYGDGSLMLYRLPSQSVWSSPQGKWKWDRDYVLEATIAKGTIRTRMLADDGKTVVVASKAVKLLKTEIGRRGMIGYQTWRGRGSFWPAADPATGVAETVPAIKELGGGWQGTDGDWQLAKGTLRSLGKQGTALCDTLRGGRGVSRCRVVAEGASAVSLLFQYTPRIAGFECRLDGKGMTLADAKGKTIWSDPKIRLAKGTAYRLEGIVDTDRIMVRVLDDAGNVLVASVERYVSDTNNDRIGTLGVSCAGGLATFSDWSWTAP